MGPDYVDFTFAFNTTIIRLKLTDIYLYYVAQVFLPPPVPNVHNRGVVPDRVKLNDYFLYGKRGGGYNPSLFPLLIHTTFKKVAMKAARNNISE